MTELVAQFFAMLFARLFGRLPRLADLAANRYEASEYAGALDEADAFAASPDPAKRQLARLLRAQVEASINSAISEPSGNQPALNGDHRPFCLEPPAAEDPGPAADPLPSPSEGQGAAPQRRRGRPPGSKTRPKVEPSTEPPAVAVTAPQLP